MSRLSIELTSEQHKRLKAMAALQGKSIKEYVLERVISPLYESDSSSDEALRQLETFLAPRVEEAETGKIVNKSVASIFSDVNNGIG